MLATRRHIIAHLDELDFHSRRAPVWTFPADGQALDLRALRDRSARYARLLRYQGVRTQDRVALMLDTGPDYVALLLALWRLNAVAVPLPLRPCRQSDSVAQLRRMAEVCGFRLLLHGPEWVEGNGATFSDRRCRALDYARLASELPHAEAIPCAPIDPSDVAVLQLSSGSTGAPKAVMVTHRMINAQLAGIHDNHLHGCGVAAIRSTASWLPLNHDMGLFMGVLHPIYEACDHILAPPGFYIRNPGRWFRLMADARVDFAFTTNSVLASSLKALRQLPAEEVDLSSLRLYVAAEKVSARVLREAARTLKPLGMPARSLRVGYGMAENALGCTTTQRSTVSAHHFVIDDSGRVRVLKDPSRDSVELVAVGEPFLDQRVTVRDRAGTELPALTLGEICVEGPCVTPGYYRNPEATRRALADGRLRTGDLGFHYDGELYFFARKDDLIVLCGRNIVPDDVEQAVERLPCVRPVSTCLFATEGAQGTTELVLLAESRSADAQALERIRGQIRGEAFRAEGVLVHHVVLCAKGTVEKTTSGKKRRRVLRARFLADQLQVFGAEADERTAVV